MRQFLLGATCGALCVGLLAFAFRQPPATPAEGQPPAAVLKNTSDPSAPERTSSPLQAGTPRNQERTPLANPQASLSSQAGHPQVALTSTTSTASPGTRAESIPSISLSEEHAKMLSPVPAEGRPPTLRELHMQFATEREDQTWSLAMEQNLSQFLAQNNNSGEFEILNIDCRSTLCEILAFGNLPNSPQR